MGFGGEMVAFMEQKVAFWCTMVLIREKGPIGGKMWGLGVKCGIWGGNWGIYGAKCGILGENIGFY